MTNASPNNEECTLIAELEAVRIARHGKEATRLLSQTTVGIAGLGGLGSNIALSLARMGIGTLVLADHDRVDLSNIHRQQYMLNQIGRYKTEALTETLRQIHPAGTFVTHERRINSDNAAMVFRDCTIVCEAFDDAYAKAMLTETLLSLDDPPYVVAASGMAGADSANRITTRRLMTRLYVAGDGESDVATEGHLYAARVAICANHQALMVLRLILGETAP